MSVLLVLNDICFVFFVSANCYTVIFCTSQHHCYEYEDMYMHVCVYVCLVFHWQATIMGPVS